jgi:hypothetical protein
MIGDDEAQHRVTEELEPLVRVVTGVLGAPRPVDERRGESVRAVEADAQTFGELVESVDGECDGRASVPCSWTSARPRRVIRL